MVLGLVLLLGLRLALGLVLGLGLVLVLMLVLSITSTSTSTRTSTNTRTSTRTWIRTRSITTSTRIIWVLMLGRSTTMSTSTRVGTGTRTTIILWNCNCFACTLAFSLIRTLIVSGLSVWCGAFVCYKKKIRNESIEAALTGIRLTFKRRICLDCELFEFGIAFVVVAVDSR